MVPITELNNGDLQIAPTHQKPTGWKAWLGENMGMGMMLAAAGLAAFTLATGGMGLAATLGLSTLGGAAAVLGTVATGGLIGGYFDKQKYERQAEEGVTVEKPSFFNRGILTDGLLKGGLNGMVLAVAAMTLVGMFTGGGFGILAGNILPYAIAGGAALFGAARGSISRKEKMDKTYQQVKTAYFIQTGQVEKARGLMQQIGAPAMAAGVGVGAGAGIAATGKAKATSIDPTAAAGAATGLFDQPAQAQQSAVGAYDFSALENHPAHQARRSFLEAEMERRAAIEQGADQPTLH